MKITDFLEDISKLTKKEIEGRSIPVPLDSEGHVQLTPDYWIEVNGVRFLKQPLKVDYIPWGNYTEDCSNIILDVIDGNFLYVFAFSTSKETTEQLGNSYSKEKLWEKGYSFFFGFSSEEVHSLD